MAFTAPEYDRYRGERAKRPAWIPLMTLTIARGWTSSRWVRWITWIALIMAFGMTVMFYIANSIVPEWRELAGRNLRVEAGDGARRGGEPLRRHQRA